MVPCSEISFFPNIYLLLDGNWMQMEPKDYMTPVQNWCAPCFLKSTIIDSDNDSQYWLLGSNFLRGYYTTFDMATSSFSMGIHTSASVDKIAPVKMTAFPW